MMVPEKVGKGISVAVLRPPSRPCYQAGQVHVKDNTKDHGLYRGYRGITARPDNEWGVEGINKQKHPCRVPAYLHIAVTGESVRVPPTPYVPPTISIIVLYIPFYVALGRRRIGISMYCIYVFHAHIQYIPWRLIYSTYLIHIYVRMCIFTPLHRIYVTLALSRVPCVWPVSLKLTCLIGPEFLSVIISSKKVRVVITRLKYL